MIDGRTALEAAAVGLLGAAVALPVARAAIGAAPQTLVRTNVNCELVPAVLGWPIAAGGLAGALAAAAALELGWVESAGLRMNVAVALLIVVMFAAGAWDDTRGDERPRGFKGHLGALKGGRLTGGSVKLVAGGLAGLAAGRVLTPDLVTAVEVGAMVALTANLINLMDRAPGRAGKVALLLATPLVLGGSAAWTVAAAGALAALATCLPADLGARAMLGDAGANPIGALVGLGLAASLDETGRLVAIVLLVSLNLASERWSFSRLIETSPPLRAFDMWGRR
jgi:hypothetical protein